MATKKKANQTPNVEPKIEKVALITRPRVTTKMRAIAFLDERGDGEFTVPEVRDALAIKQQHAFAIVAQLVEDGTYYKVDADASKRGKRGTYSTVAPE